MKMQKDPQCLPAEFSTIAPWPSCTGASAGARGSPSHRMMMTRRLQKRREAWQPVHGIQQLSGKQSPCPGPKASAGIESPQGATGLTILSYPLQSLPSQRGNTRQSLGKAQQVSKTHSNKPMGRDKDTA